MSRPSVLRLIETVFSYPALYDTSHSDYKDSKVKDRIWEEIGKTLQEPEYIMKKKWKNLRDSYMKCLSSERSGEPKKKHYQSWLWAGEMERYRPYMKVSDGRCTHLCQAVNTDYERHRLPVKQEEDESSRVTLHLAEDLFAEDEESQSDPLEPVIKRLRTAPEHNLTQTLTHPSAPHECQLDEMDYLMLAYARNIKKLSPIRQVMAKMKICQVVTELEMEELQHNQ